MIYKIEPENIKPIKSYNSRVYPNPVIKLRELTECQWYRPRPNGTLPWGCMSGMWGDVICYLGVFKQRIGIGNLILVCFDEGIVEFCAQQPFIKDIIWIKPESKEWYDKITDGLCGPPAPYPDPQIEELRKLAGLPIGTNILKTTWDYPFRESGITPKWSGARVPNKYHEEALELLSPLKDNPIIMDIDGYPCDSKTFLIHPYSLNTCNLEDHWNKWSELLWYLYMATPHNYVLVGYNITFDIPDTPRILNLANKTSSNMTLFALAEHCWGTITTINSLAHYCKVAGLNQFVFNNKSSYMNRSHFPKFIEFDITPHVEYNSEFDYVLGNVQQFVNI
jgi:hypothetical protein